MAENTLEKAIQRTAANEEWVDVPGHDDRYEASNYGRVRNKERGNMIRGSLDHKGYLVFTVYQGDYEQTNIKIHSMVAAAFLGERPAGLVVNHKDGTRTNNNIINLEYVTHKENLRHGRALKPYDPWNKGRIFRKKKVCPECNQLFLPNKATQTYCGKSCAAKHNRRVRAAK